MSKFIAPSIIASDFSNLCDVINKINNSNADLIHIDIMDGHFVPNISIGFDIVKIITKYSIIPLEIHLMVNNPEQYIDMCYKLNIKNIIVHYEILKNIYLLKLMKKMNFVVGIAINPNTSIDFIKENYLKYIDLILLMSVYPGFSGQKFLDTTYKKLETILKVKSLNNYNFNITIDGGINQSNITNFSIYDIKTLVVGKSVFYNGDIINNINVLKNYLI